MIHKALIRFIVLLLVPCLFAGDSSFALTINPFLSSERFLLSVSNSSEFSEEALAAPFQWAWRVLVGTRHDEQVRGEILQESSQTQDIKRLTRELIARLKQNGIGQTSTVEEVEQVHQRFLKNFTYPRSLGFMVRQSLLTIDPVIKYLATTYVRQYQKAAQGIIGMTHPGLIVTADQAKTLLDLGRQYSLYEYISRKRTTPRPGQITYRSFQDHNPSPGQYWHDSEYDLVAFTRGEIFQGVSIDSWSGAKKPGDVLRIVLEFSPRIEPFFHTEHFDKEHSVWVYSVPHIVTLSPKYVTRILVPEACRVEKIEEILLRQNVNIPVTKISEVMQNDGSIQKDHYYHRTGILINRYSPDDKKQAPYEEFRKILSEGFLLSANARKRREQLLEQVSQLLYGKPFDKITSQDAEPILRWSRAALYGNTQEAEHLFQIKSAPIDTYHKFYGSIRRGTVRLKEIAEKDLERPRVFLNPQGLKSRTERRQNGAFGVTEVYFLPLSDTQQRMAAFQKKLIKRFGAKLYLVDEDKLHFTTQGLELQWDNKAVGTKKEYVMHQDKKAIDIKAEPYAGVIRRAHSIHTPVVMMHVARVNWDPSIGIFWELQPHLSDPKVDPIMQRRMAWDLLQPRPPHITAAYFMQPFTLQELTDLRKMLSRYQQPFGDIVVDNAQIIAYEDLSFNAGYRVLTTVPFVPVVPVAATQRLVGAARRAA